MLYDTCRFVLLLCHAAISMLCEAQSLLNHTCGGKKYYMLTAKCRDSDLQDR